jgi:uncharacterized protein YdeI (YjbR/CyaY-like superfamily)
MNPKVDAFLARASRWQEEMTALRKVALECGLEEAIKWGKPCYTFQGKNIVVIQGFKEYYAYLFFKGYLMNDPDGLLVKVGPNTVVGRQIKFTGETSARDLLKMKATLKAYIFEAVEVEKAGRAGAAVVAVKRKEHKVPEEFRVRLEKSAALKKAFAALTPGRQRAYLFYFSDAKQAKTREARIDKYVKQILSGRGLMD